MSEYLIIRPYTMDYHKAIEFIYGLQKFGLKLGLERIENILSLLNNPHHLFDSIHIAGTNGKGSVSAMISSILMEASLKTGLFTSPHLVSFTERIRINNQQISEQEVVNISKKIQSVIKDGDIKATTFFEFVTALCLLYFAEKKVDCAVVETGLGGRLDATNILSPKLSVITTIGIDHTEYLGDTIEKISYEKAGIIKPNTPVIVSPQESSCLPILKERARQLNSTIYIGDADFHALLKESTYKGITLDFKGPININDVFIPLAGNHQVYNASTSIMATYEYLKKGYEIDKIREIVKMGLKKVSWKGRLQFVSYDPPLLIDGAHNPQASKRLAEFVRTHLSGRKIISVIGIMADKDIKGIISHLLPISSWTIFTMPQYSRSAHPDDLSKMAKTLGFEDHERVSGIKEAMTRVGELMGFSIDHFKRGMLMRENSKLSDNAPIVLITGSFYLLGEVMELLGEKAVYRDLRESFDNKVDVR